MVDEPVETRLERVAAKLEARRARLGGRMELGPPLTEAQASAFEERNRIGLPEDYRAFLTTLGNGGAGPGKGLERLDPGRVSLQLAHAFRYDPLRLTPGFEGDWGYLKPFCGALLLSREGSYEWAFHETAEPCLMLVVSGAGQGRMVLVDWEDEYFSPIYHPAPGFLAWYEEWLDTLAEGRRHETTFGRPGWHAEVMREHPNVEEAVWAARMMRARYNRWDWPEMDLARAEVLAEAALDRPEPRVRAAAVWALAGVRRQTGLLALPVLADPDPSVRREAMRTVLAAEGLEEEDTIREAFRPLLGDPDPAVRALAASTLSRLGEWAGDVLRAMLTEPGSHARRAALDGISSARYWAPHAWWRSALEEARPLLTDPDPATRASAVTRLHPETFLRSDGPPWSTPMAANVAVTDPDARVRRAAVARLLAFGDRATRLATLPALLDDEDVLIRYQALTRSGLPARSMRRFLTDPDPYFRRAALRGLTAGGAPPAEEEWPPLLADPDKEVRRWACYYAAKMHAAPGGPLHDSLHERLSDASRKVRYNAAVAIKDECDASCVPWLKTMRAAEQDRMVHYLLGSALTRLGVPPEPEPKVTRR